MWEEVVSTSEFFASGLLSLLGHSPTIASIREYSGQLNFSPEPLEDASLDLIVKAGSLAVQDEISDKDRLEIERKMREEVFGSGAVSRRLHLRAGKSQGFN